MRRLAGCLVVVLSGGCQAPPAARLTEIGAASPCVKDTDCSDPRHFFCNTRTSKCLPTCRAVADCTAAVRGAFALPACDQGLGCFCDLGVCVVAQCAIDADCGNLVCRNGDCVEPPADSAVARCEVAPDATVVPVETSFGAAVLANGADGAPVVPISVSWTASGASLVPTTDGGTALAAHFRSAGPGPILVTAAIGATRCSASVTAVTTRAVPPQTVEVMALDALTGRPVPGVEIIAPLASAPAPQPAITGAGGTARLAVGAAREATISAFHRDYDYFTIARVVLPGLSEPGRFLLVPLRRNPTSLVGGASGRFRDLTYEVDAPIQGGVVGISVAQSLADLSTESLAGPRVVLPVGHRFLAGALSAETVPVPLGATVRGLFPLKERYAAMGPAGVCWDGGAPDEARTTAGTCAERAAWAVSTLAQLGELPLGSIKPSEDLRDRFASGVMSQSSRELHSVVVRDFSYPLQAPQVQPDGGMDLSGALAPLDLEFRQVPMKIEKFARLSMLPKFREAHAKNALLLFGARVPGRGWVPLGVGAGESRSSGGGRLDTSGLTDSTLLRWRAAPPHHGLEGWPLEVVVLARSPRTGSPLTGSATSAAVTPLPAERLRPDPFGRAPVVLPDFPAFPERAVYESRGVTLGGRAQRLLRFTSDPGLSGTSVLQFVFTDRSGRRWVTVMDPAQALSGVSLPRPPPGFEDRTLLDGTGSAPARFQVQTLRLADGARALSFDDVVEWNATNLDRAMDFTTGFASMDYP